MHRNLAKLCEAIVEQRPIDHRQERLNHKLHQFKHQKLKLLNQYGDMVGDRAVKPRMYSLHEPEVACIAKGKASTRYVG